jgi:hypothetical protein
MNKQVSFVITAAVMLTAFVTVALYTSSVHAQAPGANVTMAKNATAAGANMTKGAVAGAVANMTKNATK